MRLHYLQHVPYENLGTIQEWAKELGHTITKTVLYYDEALPGIDSFDFLIVMGGAMNIYEEKDYPWLAREKTFIREAIDAGKLVLGVCLGAQLIADVLGGKVTKNREKEIGWFEVSLLPDAKSSPVFRSLPQKFVAFHWHGDTFSIPAGAKPVAFSAGCANQAFECHDGKVIGLQFHLEMTDDSIRRLANNCGSEITEGRHIQQKEEMLGQAEKLKDINVNLRKILNAMVKA